MKDLIYQNSFYTRVRDSVIMVLLLCISNDFCSGQPIGIKEFLIDDFVVSVTSFRSGDTGGNFNPGNIRTYIASNPGNGLMGTGYINFKGRIMPVSFNNIKIRVEGGTKLIATAGQVIGASNRIVNYAFRGFNIIFKWSTLIIEPAIAKAVIAVKVPLHSCSSDPASFVELVSTACQITHEGSIYAENFTGNGEVSLKESVYLVDISNIRNGIIKLGKGTKTSIAENGAFLLGKDHNGLFSIKCFIGEDASRSELSFTLFNSVERHLEYDSNEREYYYVRLKEGQINFKYADDTLTECKGQFPAKIKLPPRFNKIADIPVNAQIDTFYITLYTDKTNSLFDSINLNNKSTGKPYIFKFGPITLEPEKYAAWIYFPNWIRNSSEYDIFQKEPVCTEITDLLRRANDLVENKYDKNPGLTILKGTIYLTSSQIDYPSAVSLSGSEANTVKTFFSGYLTFTPFGLHGTVSSNGNTFVPFIHPMDSCKIHKTYMPYSWEQITAKGDTLPDKIDSKFTIQKLRILQMKLKEMKICKDAVDTRSTFFRYYVHFPHPTYINLEFEDNSFDHDGKFSKAYGPVNLISEENLNYRSTSVPGNSVHNNGKNDFVQVPYGYFFWEWRLPVTFADRGIEIDYQKLKQSPDSGIIINMSSDRRNSLHEIYGNELGISPLYSDSSAFRKGVRFKGFLSLEGMFHLDSFDTKPFFGKAYSKKFKCELNHINLAPVKSSPSSRQFDFNWDGRLQFPFFCNNDANTWRLVNFQIKDLLEIMPLPINIERTEKERLKCDGGSLTNFGSGIRMSLTVQNLGYERNLGGFLCDMVRKDETGQRGRLELFSYAHALFIELEAVKSDLIISQTQAGSCNQGRNITEKLKDAYSSDAITDLVCYDRLAKACRSTDINNKSCCSDFYYGTYQIISNKTPTDSIVTFSATKAKYYRYETVNKLRFENSKLAFRSDDASGTDVMLDIPGMQFSKTDEGYFGAFGSTYTDVAFSLPYEGEFRFFLDPKCGYFYMLGAGSFTFFGIPLRGQVFLFHAPRNVFGINPFSSSNTTPLIEDLSIRSLSDDSQTFTHDTQLDQIIDENTVVTGFLSTGAASYGMNWSGIDFGIQAGLTNYFYHSNDNNTFRAGMFGNVAADGSLDLKLFSVTAHADLKLALKAGILAGDYNSIMGSLRSTNIELAGELNMRGCAGLFLLGECCAGFRTGASISTDSGLKIEDVDLYSCCDCDD